MGPRDVYFNRVTGGTKMLTHIVSLGAGGDFGGIDFSKLGGGAGLGGEEEEDEDEEDDDDMPPLEGEEDGKAEAKAEAKPAEESKAAA